MRRRSPSSISAASTTAKRSRNAGSTAPASAVDKVHEHLRVEEIEVVIGSRDQREAACRQSPETDEPEHRALFENHLDVVRREPWHPRDERAKTRDVFRADARGKTTRERLDVRPDAVVGPPVMTGSHELMLAAQEASALFRRLRSMRDRALDCDELAPRMTPLLKPIREHEERGLVLRRGFERGQQLGRRRKKATFGSWDARARDLKNAAASEAQPPKNGQKPGDVRGLGRARHLPRFPLETVISGIVFGECLARAKRKTLAPTAK